MAIDRRSALMLMAGAVLAPGPVAGGEHRGLYVTAGSGLDWRHGATLLDHRGEIVARFDLPSRGHGAAIDPSRSTAVLFARRPGTFAAIIDVRRRRLVKIVESAPDRHFYGHGCFSADGRFLHATENDFDNERGVLGIYDAQAGFSRVGEVPSHGIGPHEAVLMPDGETVAVANGGVLTHPSMPRMKLNIADMRPSLSLIRLRDGALLAEHRPEPGLEQLSIRHLAANRAGDVAFAMQWEGDERKHPPLVGLLRRGEQARFLAAPAEVQDTLRNYCGSVAFSADGSRFLVSAPRGNVLTEWSANGDFLKGHSFDDGSAAAAIGRDGFLVTNGNGRIGRIDPAVSGVRPLADHPKTKWDNHIRRIR